MRLAIAVVSTVLAACSSATEVNQNRVLGVITGYGEGPIVEAAVNGRLVSLTVLTYGTRCYSLADTEVRVNGLTVQVLPFDFNPGCPERDLHPIEHKASFEVKGSGFLQLMVRGIDASTRSATNVVGDTITVERSITVQ
jgi:hypothetical protein